ncbi:hypothetical protein ACRAWF_11055 [Streptomyces sp. L7]
MHRLQPVGNGLHTDHPVPGLPMVDDTHIPIDDPAAVEAIGRHEEGGTWGRWDRDRTAEGAWLAFTTDPIRHDLAWVVRHHPEHGRTILVVRDKDASPWHSNRWGPQLLFRQGGYWWDGTNWYRPEQVWDAASERYDRRPVKAATTITAEDLLDDNAHPAGGRILKVATPRSRRATPRSVERPSCPVGLTPPPRCSATVPVRSSRVGARTRCGSAHRRTRDGHDRRHRRVHSARVHLPRRK